MNPGWKWLLGTWLAWGVWAILHYAAAQRLHVGWIALLITIGALPLDGYLVWQALKTTGVPPLSVAWIPLVMGVLTTVASILFIQSVKFYNASVATTVEGLYPLLGLVYWFIRGERLTIAQSMGVAMALIGGVLMVRE